MFDHDQRGVNSAVDVLDGTDHIDKTSLFTGGESMKKFVALLILPQNLCEFLGHRQAVFAGVGYEFDIDRVPINYAEFFANRLVYRNYKLAFIRHQSTLKSVRAVKRAYNAARPRVGLELLSNLGRNI
jgi:hypothetical protein